MESPSWPQNLSSQQLNLGSGSQQTSESSFILVYGTVVTILWFKDLVIHIMIMVMTIDIIISIIIMIIIITRTTPLDKNVHI